MRIMSESHTGKFTDISTTIIAGCVPISSMTYYASGNGFLVNILLII